MGNLRDELPVAVYRYLPHGWGLDPLPPVHDGRIYHYASIAGAHGMIETDEFRASHVLDLNDPNERRYGWGVIRDRFKENPPSGSSGALSEIERMLDDAEEPGSWYPRPFVASASTAADNLTQYRLYGQCQVELAGGAWTAAAPDDPYDSGDLWSAWRKVLYGPAEAVECIDRMLAAAAAIIDEPEPWDASDEALTAMLAIEILALHIKHPAYEDEREIRLVFSAPRHHRIGKVRVSGDNLVTYVEARPVSMPTDGMVRSVKLGPLVNSERNIAALKAHHQNHHPDSSAMNLFEDDGLPVSATETRYSGK